jgi:uroporphyrinogen-III synthase
VRASRGRDTLPRLLVQAGAIVDEIAAYVHRDVTSWPPQVDSLLCSRAIDAVTATSTAIAHSSVALIGARANHLQWISLSANITQTLRDLGVKYIQQADQNTIPSLIATIVETVDRWQSDR